MNDQALSEKHRSKNAIKEAAKGVGWFVLAASGIIVPFTLYFGFFYLMDNDPNLMGTPEAAAQALIIAGYSNPELDPENPPGYSEVSRRKSANYCYNFTAVNGRGETVNIRVARKPGKGYTICY